MASLLGFATTPTRANLLENIEAAGLLTKASNAATEIFLRLELQELHPLQIVKQLNPARQQQCRDFVGRRCIVGTGAY
uniref:Uncharacterized protein n=1 Tax=Peronospora matthiolae TaxID=2874970 RepID=A0AAV1UT99_9STRA